MSVWIIMRPHICNHTATNIIQKELFQLWSLRASYHDSVTRFPHLSMTTRPQRDSLTTCSRDTMPAELRDSILYTQHSAHCVSEV